MYNFIYRICYYTKLFLHRHNHHKMSTEIHLIKGTQVLFCLEWRDQTVSDSSPPWPPACGGDGGSITFTPVEKLQPGDLLIGIDHFPHRVERCSSYIYNGPIITIQHTLSGSDVVDYVLPNRLILAMRRVQSLSESGGWSSIPSGHFQRARALRNQMTPPEWKLWGVLCNEGLGVKFRAQHPIGPYIADFYTRAAGLVVEVDGEIAHRTPEQITHDRIRDAWMRSIGLKVLRYTASDISTNLEGVIIDISYHLRERVVNDFPQAQWLFSQNISSSDEVFIGATRMPSQVLKVCEVTFQSCWQKVFLESHGSIITQTLIHQA